MTEQEKKGAGDRREVLREKGLEVFDIGLTAEEMSCIAALKIEKQPLPFEYFGKPGEELVAALTEYFTQLGENSQESMAVIARLAGRVAEQVTQAVGRDWCWANVRVYMPTDAFDVPMWHQDGDFARPEEGEHNYHGAFTIKGNATLFGAIDEKDRRRFDELQIKMAQTMDWPNDSPAPLPNEENLKARRDMDALVERSAPLGQGQVAVFGAGYHEAPIHSWPPVPDVRVYLQVYAGTEEQITSMQGPGLLDEQHE